VGDDTYVLADGSGSDTITELDGEGTDLIDFSAATVNVTVTKNADGTFALSSSSINLTFDSIESLAGGTGTNSLNFTAATEAVNVNLQAGRSSDFGILTGFKNIAGSAFADTLIGNNLANTISGGAGNDYIIGNGGADDLDGGAGIDQLAEFRDVSFVLTNTTLTATGTGITGSEVDTIANFEQVSLTGGASANTLDASGYKTLTNGTALSLLNHGAGVDLTAPTLQIKLRDNTALNINLAGSITVGDVLTKLNAANPARLSAAINAAGNAFVLTDLTANQTTGNITATASTVATALGLGVGSGATLTGAALSGNSVMLDGGSTIQLSVLNGGSGVRISDEPELELLGKESTTLLATLNQGLGIHPVAGADFRVTLTDGVVVDVDLGSATTLQGVLDAINAAGTAVQLNRLTAQIDPDNGQAILLRDSKSLGQDLKVTALNNSPAAFELGLLKTGAKGALLGNPLSDISNDLRVTLRDGTSFDIDLTGAATVQDVLDTLNAQFFGFTAGLNAAADGLVLRDATVGAGTFAVTALNGSFAAADLHLNVASVGGVINGGTLTPGTFRLDGRGDNDVLKGSDGDDTLIGGGGADAITGNGGLDLVVATADLNMTLTNTSLVVGAETTTLSGVEQARLTGGDSANTIDASAFSMGTVYLMGRGGDDILKGGTQDDFLSGGLGLDNIDGGGGVNTLVESGARAILTGTNLDLGEGTSEAVTVSLTGTVTSGTYRLTFCGKTT
jgi:hypothetical protein